MLHDFPLTLEPRSAGLGVAKEIQLLHHCSAFSLFDRPFRNYPRLRLLTPSVFPLSLRSFCFRAPPDPSASTEVQLFAFFPSLDTVKFHGPSSSAYHSMLPVRPVNPCLRTTLRPLVFFQRRPPVPNPKPPHFLSATFFLSVFQVIFLAVLLFEHICLTQVALYE